MNSQEEKRRKINNQLPEDLESPFLEGELFAREVDEEWQARLGALEAESPFQHVFEQPWALIGAGGTESAESFDDEFTFEELDIIENKEYDERLPDEEFADELSDKEFYEVIEDALIQEEIHSETFLRARDRRGARTGIEIEATWELACPGKTIDSKTLYQLLSRDEWRVFREDIRPCTACAAFSSGLGLNVMPWDQVSHDLREKNPYVWLTVAGVRAENIRQSRVPTGTDLMDDWYFDDGQFTLFSNKYTVRGRKRWDSWRSSDNPRMRRLLIGTKKDTGVTAGGIKRGEKEDIRFPGNNAARAAITLIGDIRSGFVNWQNRRRAIRSIRMMYEDLRSRGILSKFISGSKKDVLDLQPQVFIRSLRSRYHLRETPLRRLREILVNGENRLRTLRNNAQRNLGSLAPVHQLNAEAFIKKVDETLNYSLVANRADALLKQLDPAMRVNSASVRALRPRGRGGRPSNYRDLQKERIVAETLSKLFHELAEFVYNSMILNLISGVSADISLVWRRQIEAAGSACLGLWFDRSRAFYVPLSRRSVDRDFLIDTLDGSGMFTADAWAGITEAEQTNQKKPDIQKLFLATLVNEIQIELGHERAYMNRINQLQRVQQPTPQQQQNLAGAQFVLNQYRDAMTILVEMKKDQIINGVNKAIGDAKAKGHPVPTCNNWAWQPVTQGKGERALSILNTRKVPPPTAVQPELEEFDDIENQYERSYHFISDSEDYTGDEEAEDVSQHELNTTMDDEYIESELFPETEDKLESGDDEFEDDAEAFYRNIDGSGSLNLDHELAEEPEPFDEEVFAGTETGIVGSDNTGNYEDYLFESTVEQATQDDSVEFNVEEMRCNESPTDDWEQDMLLEEIAELLPPREFPSVIGQMPVAYETPPLPRGVPAFEHWFQPMKRNTTTNKWIPNGPEKKLESINPGFFDPVTGGLKIASPLNNSLKNLLMTNSEFNHYLSRDALLDGAAKGRDKIRVALVDLTGSKLLNPEFAGWGSSVAVNGASCPKVAALYAAFQLLNDLKHIASPLGISERSALIRSMSNDWRRVVGRPKLERFLGTSNPPNLEFSNAVKTAIANIIHPHKANHAASVLIDVVGFPYIASLMWQSGLRHPTLGGLWLTSSYPPGARWGNPVKPPPPPVYGHNATALSLAAFFTLLAQGRLVNSSMSSNIKSALSTASWFMGVLPSSAPNTPQKIASKVGLLTKHVHEAGFIENGQFRYAVAIMTTGIRAGEGIELLRKLIVKLDSLIRTNNP